MNAIYALVIGLAVGAFGGYRYSEGRAAVEKVEEQRAQLAAANAIVKHVNEQIDAATKNGAAAGRKAAALDAQQTMERNEYVKTPAAPDCYLDAHTFSLLNDAVRRANGGSANAANRMSDALPVSAHAEGREF